MHKCIQTAESNPYCITGNQSQKLQLKALNNIYRLLQPSERLHHVRHYTNTFNSLQSKALDYTILQLTSTGEGTSVCLMYAIQLDTDKEEGMQRRNSNHFKITENVMEDITTSPCISFCPNILQTGMRPFNPSTWLIFIIQESKVIVQT